MPKHELHNKKKKSNYILLAILLLVIVGLYQLTLARFGL